MSEKPEKAKKERVFDKPRITSTVIIGIFLVLAMFFAILFVGTSWAAVKEAADSAAESQDDAAGQVVGATAVAFAGAIGMVLVIIVYFAVLIDTAIILPFSIKIRKTILLYYSENGMIDYIISELDKYDEDETTSLIGGSNE